MSREGSYRNIDNIVRDGAGQSITDRYKRTALGNAVRFSTMLNLLEDPGERRFTTNEEFASALEDDIKSQVKEYNDAIERGTSRNLSDRTVQEALQSRGYGTRLGRTIARETAFNASRTYSAGESPNRFGTSNAANQFFGSFFQDPELGDNDFFGSKVLYDNVFGPLQENDGSHSLTLRDHLIPANPENDYGVTASQKVLRGIVRSSLADATSAIERLDLEFSRFIGESQLDNLSMTGSGLQSARDTIRRVQLSGIARERNNLARNNNYDPTVDPNIRSMTGGADFDPMLSMVRDSLDQMKDVYRTNRSGQDYSMEVVNKSGVKSFVDLWNSAENRISIQTYQFQNDTASAALIDVIKRRVMEGALDQIQHGKHKAFQVDFTVAYPRERDMNNQLVNRDHKGTAASGATTFSILGPNMIEAMKLKEVQAELQSFLVNEMGLTGANIEDYLNLNIQFRDKRFHPKLYLSDTMAMIGSENLTGPVGNSINQAGSNFEQMIIVREKYKEMTDAELANLKSYYGTASMKGVRENSTTRARNADLRSSLLYRQIVNMSDTEREFSARGYEGYGLMHRRGQVGLSGDIFQHLKQTLDFTHEFHFGQVGKSTNAPGSKEVVKDGGKFHMFFVLDQAFMLQYGSTAFMGERGTGRFEMGDEHEGNVYGESDPRRTAYRQLQGRLMDLLITNRATVTVDPKNYKGQVFDPLANKIMALGDDNPLKQKFIQSGKNLGLLAGAGLFGPRTVSELDTSKDAMINFMRQQGLTESAGFSRSDLVQIMAMGSGNIKMASTPRQHVKSFGLMQYGDDVVGPQLKSFYSGSSNMGMYSLGIPSGGYDKAGRPIYTADDFKSVNTEMGILLGTDVNTGKTRLDPRTGDVVPILKNLSNRERTVSADMKAHASYLPGNIPNDMGISQNEMALSADMERDELIHMQERFVLTHSQLGNNRIENPANPSMRNTPLWMENVNHGGLTALKSRLEALRSDLGLNDTAFKINERLAEDGSIKSFNVTIDMARILGQKGFMDASAQLPKLNFELSVLNGPNRGADFTKDRTQGVPGFVYFVDKNKVVGNGLFVNQGTTSIDVLGRANYGDDFVRGVDEITDPTSGVTRKTLAGAYTTVEAGKSAHMSSLDLVPQMFGTMISEGLYRMAVKQPATRWAQIESANRDTVVIEEFMSKALFGIGTHISGEDVKTIADGFGGQRDIKVARDTTARQVLLDNLGYLNGQEFVGKISVALFGQNTSQEIIRKISDPYRITGLSDDMKLNAKEQAFADLARTFTLYADNQGLSKNQVLAQVTAQLKNVIAVAPEVLNEILRYGDFDSTINQEIQAFKEYQRTIFDPFLQAREERTYGGQQGFYKTHLLGIGSTSDADTRTAEMMTAFDPQGGIQNARALARFQALNYNPLTDLSEYMYRSIASKSTSMTADNPDANSLLFEQEARSMGDAANMRLMGSIGIGTELEARAYLEVDGGKLVASAQLRDMAMQMTGITDAKDAALQAKLKKLVDIYTNKFGASVKDGELITKAKKVMQFYTGSKIAQLPQRIKNAMGARPMWQYGLEAQRVLEGTFAKDEVGPRTIKDLTQSYITKQQAVLDNVARKRAAEILKKYNKGTAPSDIISFMANFKGDLSEADRDQLVKFRNMQAQMFRTSTYGLGAIFRGNIKTILSEEQAEFVDMKRQELLELFGGKEDDNFQEFLRVEVMKASLTNSGLGKMISGSDQVKHSISLLQLNGTYTDTFLANPLYGTTYADSATYKGLRDSGAMYAGVQNYMIETGEVLNRGMREGYIETQQRSIKGSMVGEGGMQTILKQGDRVVEIDADGRSVIDGGRGTGRFALERYDETTGKWSTVKVDTVYLVKMDDGNVVKIPERNMTTSLRSNVVGVIPGQEEILDEKRNMRNIGNVIDNTSFSPVGTSSVGAVATTNYGRAGEKSIDMIYDQEFRAGNFDNNEYLQVLHRLRSVKPGGGRRVEGTDSHALVKGVANFAGQVNYRLQGQTDPTKMGYFQMMEAQMLEKQNGEFTRIGGSLGWMAENIEEIGTVRNAQGEVERFTPLSSMIHGMYNPNNFKSFFWSHGAKILTANRKDKVTGEKDYFLLKNVFQGDGSPEANLKSAQKMMGGLIMAFGDEFIATHDVTSYGKGNRGKIKAALVEAMLQGKYGETYRSLAAAQMMLAVNDSHTTQDMYEKVYKNINKNSIFGKDSESGALNLAGVSMIDEQEAMAIMRGTASEDEVNKFLKKIQTLTGLEDDGSSKYGSRGFLTFHGTEGMANRQAALVTTAIDLFQQMAAQKKRFNIPADMDLSDEKVRKIMMTVGGLGGAVSPEEEAVYAAAVEGLSSTVNVVGVFTDIAFSLSKDPTGTQTVGRHEAQHLITPYLGQIKEYQEGGQLSKIQHTMASLIALSQGTKTGSLYWGKMKSQYNQVKAMSLRDTANNADIVFSPWSGQKFLGFYQGGTKDVYTHGLINEYKQIAREIATTDQNDPKTYDLEKSVRSYVKERLRYTGDRAETEVMKLMSKGYVGFQEERLRRVENDLAEINDRVQANAFSTVGKTAEFLKGMSNDAMFFAMPMISFQRENGALVARLQNEDVYTFLPAAAMMRDLGAQHQDFIDPIMNNYKALSTLFTPGHIASKALQKVLLHGQDSSGTILTSDEQKALQEAMSAAVNMLPEVEKAIGSKRTQEIFAGSHKYQGFTATGIGSMLVPMGSAVLSQSKLNEVTGSGNKKRLAAYRDYQNKVDAGGIITEQHVGDMTKLERALMVLDESVDTTTDHKYIHTDSKLADVSQQINKILGIKDNKVKEHSIEKKIQSTMARIRQRRHMALIMSQENLPKAQQIETIYGILRDFDYAYDQMNALHSDKRVQWDAEKSSAIYDMRMKIQSMKKEVLEAAAQELGFQHKTPIYKREDGTSKIFYRRKASEITMGERLQLAATPGVIKKGKLSGGEVAWVVRIASADDGDQNFVHKVFKISDYRNSIEARQAAKDFVLDDSYVDRIEAALYQSRYDDHRRLSVLKAQIVAGTSAMDHTRGAQGMKGAYVGPFEPGGLTPAEWADRIEGKEWERRARKYFKSDQFNKYTDPVTGRTLDEKFNKTEITDISKIQKFYRAGKEMLVHGMDEGAMTRFKDVQVMAERLNVLYEDLLGAVKKGDPEAHKLYKNLRDIIKTQKRTIDTQYNYAKNNKDHANKYIYTASTLNIRALENKLSLLYVSNLSTKKASAEVIERLQGRARRFEKVEAILNIRSANTGHNIFRGLGSAPVELGDMDGKLNGVMQARGLKDENGSIKALTFLDEVDAIYKPRLEKAAKDDAKFRAEDANRRTHKLQAANSQIDIFIQSYKAQRDSLSKMDVTRNAVVGEGKAERERMQAIANEAHADQIKRTDKLIEELETLKGSMSESSEKNDYKRVFETIHDRIIEYDRTNLATVEFFRSPTPGGTDPRLHTLRAIEGVAAFNQAIEVMNRTSIDTAPEKVTFDEGRNSTATYAAALGIVTYGGGDWDGDPYTTIFNKAGDFADKIGRKRSEYERAKITLDALLKANGYTSLADAEKSADAEFVKSLKEKSARAKAAKDVYEQDERKYKAWLGDTSRDFQMRARKQVANFLGIDYRYLIGAEGAEDFAQDPDDEMRYQKTHVRGFGDQTYDADQLHALLNTGYGLFEGVENSGTKILQLNRNISALTGIKRSRLRATVDGPGDKLGNYDDRVFSTREGLQFLGDLQRGYRRGVQAVVDYTGDAEGLAKAQNEMVYKRLKSMVVRAEGKEQEFLNGVLKRVDERRVAGGEIGSDGELRALAQNMIDLGTEIEHRSSNDAILSRTSTEEQVAKAAEFTNQWVGGHLWNSITGNKAMQKVMGLGVGDAVDGSMFNLLTQTLGKAGGEILGKTYNTIIGSTFRDAPVISLGRTLSDKNSTLYKATQLAFAKQEMSANSDPKWAGKHVNEISDDDARAYVESGTGTFAEMDTYVKLSMEAMGKSEKTQGFMKNIHQILRDSIKLKGEGKEQIEMLKAKTAEYEKITIDIDALKPDPEDPDAFIRSKQELVARRDAIVNEMASSLGPGAGLKALVGMDRLIKTASAGGMTAGEFGSTFMDDGVGSDKFRRSVGELRTAGLLDTTDEAQLTSLKDGTYTEDVKLGVLRKVAQYETKKGIVSMVTSYRFENALKHNNADIQELGTVREMAYAHKRRLIRDQLRYNPTSKDDPMDRYYDQEIRNQVKGSRIENVRGSAIPINRTADANVAQAHLAVDRILSTRYYGGDTNTGTAIEDSNYREALAMHLGLQYDQLYDEEGVIRNDGKAQLQKAADDNGTTLDDYLLRFDMTYQTSYEANASLFGAHGERMEAFASAQEMRVLLSRGFGGDKDGIEEGMHRLNQKAAALGEKLLDNMDNEMMTTMAQLMTQNKLGTSGMDIMTKVYGGIMSSMLEGGNATFDITREETEDVIDPKTGKKTGERKVKKTQKVAFNDMTQQERDRVTTRNVLGALISADPDKANQTSSTEQHKAGVITQELLKDDAWLDAYVKSLNGTVTDQEKNALNAITEEMIVKTTESDDLFDKFIDTVMPGGELKDSNGNTVAKSEAKARMTSYVQQKRVVRRAQYAQEQRAARDKYIDANPVMKRSSMMGQLDDKAASLLSKNKVANSLDLLVPLALTVFGQAISEGSIDGNHIQGIGGTALTSFSYIRASLLDDEDFKRVGSAQRARVGVRALTGVYKFRNALQRHDGDYAKAFVDSTIRETVAMGMNQALMGGMKIQNTLTHKVFGANMTPAMRSLDMNRYKATQQLAGNVGASLISAVSSTLITGVLMKTTIQPAMTQASQVLQSFQPASQYTAANNAEIARQRAQQQAYETMITAETDGAEQEISAYNVETSSTYGDYDQGTKEDLFAVDVLEVDGTGNVAVNFFG